MATAAALLPASTLPPSFRCATSRLGASAGIQYGTMVRPFLGAAHAAAPAACSTSPSGSASRPSGRSPAKTCTCTSAQLSRVGAAPCAAVGDERAAHSCAPAGTVPRALLEKKARARKVTSRLAAGRSGLSSRPSALQLRLMSPALLWPTPSLGVTSPALSVDTSACSAGAGSVLFFTLEPGCSDVVQNESLKGARPSAPANMFESPMRHCVVSPLLGT
mmetsp:Transcript_10031/g.31400  ORF Transcript_10031/g.31400 Transcript_10031/m.31400 type:complete len:219 (-) Transcript_10031:1494-2150(-)